MAAAQIDQFTQALFGKAESVIIVCAILILVVGIPLYWLRLKAERGLIRRDSFFAGQTPSGEVRGQYRFVRDSSALSRLQRVDGKETCAARVAQRLDFLGL